MHYRKWKDLDNHVDTVKANNFLRVFSELDKIYRDSNLSFDIIESLLVDIQLDISINGQLSRELRLSGKIGINDKFSKYAYMAKKARTSFRLNDSSELTQLYDDLIDLIGTFPFLRDLSFTKTPIENACIYQNGDPEKEVACKLYNVVFQYDNLLSTAEKEFDEDLDTNFTLIMKGSDFYCLERMETLESTSGERSLLLSYWQIGMFNNNLNIHVLSEGDLDSSYFNNDVVIRYDGAYEYFSYIMMPFEIIDYDANSDRIRINNFYNINYKYIKNLALSISDVLNENSKNDIVNLYGKKHNFSWKKEKNNTECLSLVRDGENFQYTWSEIITLLMVEEGILKILGFLLKNNHDTKMKFLGNLEFRFGKNLFNKAVVLKDIEATIDSFNQKIEADGDINETNKQAYNRELTDYHTEILTNKIVYYISKAVNGNEFKDYKIKFPVSIRSKILLLEEINDSDLDLETKIESIRSIAFSTIKNLYCFYSGFFAYADVKKNFDDESFYRSLTYAEITTYQKQANNAFSKAVKKCMKNVDKLSYKDPCGMIELFKEFCLSIHSSTSNNDQKQLLKSFLGKSQIVDVRKLNELSAALKCKIDEESIENVVEKIKSIFNYFMTGRSKKSNISAGMIFPYVATCEYIDMGRDGNVVYHFSIISAKGQEKKLRVLSEFSYELNKKYYFVPNKLSSDEKLNLWIEPIIIDFESFDNSETGEKE